MWETIANLEVTALVVQSTPLLATLDSTRRKSETTKLPSVLPVTRACTVMDSLPTLRETMYPLMSRRICLLLACLANARPATTAQVSLLRLTSSSQPQATTP